MITTRPLLPDALTASWIELKWHRWKNLRFRSSSACASAPLILCWPTVGRTTYPADCACAIDRCARVRELRWQTTFVALSERAESSVRAVGTCPPAHGSTEQSGAGSGQ